MWPLFEPTRTCLTPAETTLPSLHQLLLKGDICIRAHPYRLFIRGTMFLGEAISQRRIFQISTEENLVEIKRMRRLTNILCKAVSVALNQVANQFASSGNAILKRNSSPTGRIISH